jgi:sugar O-acyltransferase (sialic acid O-acetyltransferase NeuD family)
MSEKRNLFIIGASNFGREMESWLELIPVLSRDWEIRGFLHYFEGKSPLGDFPTDLKIVGDWRNYPLTKNDYCIIAVADCSWKERIYHHLKGKTSFLTYIAPDVKIGKFNTIGEGSLVCPGSIITTNVTLGNCIILNIGSQIGHDCKVGDFSSVMPSVNLGGNVTVGSKVFIGTNATILPNMTIGNGATIGAGSVVLKKVSEGTTVFGNPAREITM